MSDVMRMLLPVLFFRSSIIPFNMEAPEPEL
jgi:hypothetical protein